jgi:hypothetical protein
MISSCAPAALFFPLVTAADFRTLVLAAVGELQQTAIERRAKVEEFQRKHRTGLLTLLFTDIVDSAKLKQTLGDPEAVTVQRKLRAVHPVSSAPYDVPVVFARDSITRTIYLRLAMHYVSNSRFRQRQTIYTTNLKAAKDAMATDDERKLAHELHEKHVREWRVIDGLTAEGEAWQAERQRVIAAIEGQKTTLKPGGMRYAA